MAKTNVYGINGDVASQVDVPAVFSTPYRPDIIKKASTGGMKTVLPVAMTRES